MLARQAFVRAFGFARKTRLFGSKGFKSLVLNNSRSFFSFNSKIISRLERMHIDLIDNKHTYIECEKFIPDEIKSIDFYQKLYEQNKILFSEVPNKYKTYRMCLTAVERHGLDLEYVPENMKLYQMCKSALKSQRHAIKFVPINDVGEKVCIDVLKDGSIYTFENMPNELKTTEICSLAIDVFAANLEFVPEDKKTKELCEKAIKLNSYTINYVPEKFKTSSIIYLKAIIKNPYILRDIPKDEVTEEMCEIAIECDMRLDCMPTEFKSDKICLQAVKRNSFNIQHVPEDKKTKEMCEIALKDNSQLFKHVPDKFKTQEMCDKAVNGWCYNLKEVPMDKRTNEMCVDALLGCSSVFEHVPDKFKTLNMCWDAIERMGFNLKFVPKNHIYKVMCLVAIKGGASLDNVPFEFRTLQICIEYAQNYGNLNQLAFPIEIWKRIKFDGDKFEIMELSYKEFREIYGNKEFVKLTCENEKHHGVEFKTGLNVDPKKFNPEKTCTGGIYFIERNQVKNWKSYNCVSMVYARTVTVPPDARICIEHGKFKANKVILGERVSINKFL